jgi:hypothetical protein
MRLKFAAISMLIAAAWPGLSKVVRGGPGVHHRTSGRRRPGAQPRHLDCAQESEGSTWRFH